MSIFIHVFSSSMLSGLFFLPRLASESSPLANHFRMKKECMFIDI